MSRLFSASPFPVRPSSPSLPPQKGQAVHKAIDAQMQIRRRLVGGMLVLLFAVVAGRLVQLTLAPPMREGVTPPAPAKAFERARILDRHGRVLAEDMDAWEIYAHPRQITYPEEVAAALAETLGVDETRLLSRLNAGSKFIWISRKASAETWQAVHDLGLPGVYARQRRVRVYLNGRVAAHLLGGVNIDNKGASGVEWAANAQLSGAAAVDIRLSIDLRVQAAMQQELGAAMARYAALGASAVLLNIETGEILAMASRPDFDANFPPPLPQDSPQAGASPRFNRPVQGVYEMGSIFKIFTVAAALENGVALDAQLDARKPIRRGGFTIDDFYGKYRMLSVEEGLIYSSNIAMARLAAEVGPEKLSELLERVGLMGRLELQLPTGERGKSLPPARWGEVETMTVGYGHGIAVTPLHLIAALGTLSNQGCRVRPTLLKREEGPACEQVVAPQISRTARALLRRVVLETSGRGAAIEGYELGGKTGTAYKPALSGGYDQHRRISSFATVFPASRPQYGFIISFDEPKILDERSVRPTAGHTAAPATRRMLTRLMPLLGFVAKPEEASWQQIMNGPLLFEEEGAGSADSDKAFERLMEWD